MSPVLPGMVARNRGLIINLGSTAATYPYPGGIQSGHSRFIVTVFVPDCCIQSGIHGGR